MGRPLPMAVLVSGTGTNLQALIDDVHGQEAQIVAVAANVPDAPALGRARAAGIESRVFAGGEFPDRAERDERMAQWLRQRGTELVVLAGYMHLLSPGFLACFPGAVINVHPSLLPAFPGLQAIEQALAYGVKVFGVTVHFVDEEVDSGSIIAQRAIELPDARTPAHVREALRPLEHLLLCQAVRQIARGAVRRDPEHPRRTLLS